MICNGIVVNGYWVINVVEFGDYCFMLWMCFFGIDS